MSRTPGSPKTGGRKPGTPNRRSVIARERVEAMGFDPLEGLVLIARGDWEKLGYKAATFFKSTGESSGYDEHYISPEMRLSATKELCTYIYPKLKSVEVSADPESPGLPFVVSRDTIELLVESARKAKDKPQGEIE